jgi:hypothetical protein
MPLALANAFFSTVGTEFAEDTESETLVLTDQGVSLNSV